MPRNSAPAFVTLNKHGKVLGRRVLLAAALTTLGLIALGIIGLGWFAWQQYQSLQQTRMAEAAIRTELLDIENQLSSASAELTLLQNEDQFVRNEALQEEIENIQSGFKRAITTYESILDLRGDGAKTQELEAQFSQALTLLSNRNYASASTTIAALQGNISKLQAQLAAASAPVPANVPASNTPPGSGYARQVVDTDAGQFVVDILTADLNSTRVQVETASDKDCADGCPVDSLAAFVSRSGGFAGINGPYFCPAEYPSCAGKTNSFDTLLMNKQKTYFNSDNNVYSSVPALIFSGNSARLVGKSQEWGRDTGVDAVIASQPMLLSGGEVTFGGSGDPKQGSRGSRSFIGTKDNFVYIGVVRNATVAEVARVLKALGLHSALNLDSGGSTAFQVNGRYVAGPGRNTPFGIVLVRK